LRTVIENKTGLKKQYDLHNIVFKSHENKGTQTKSCFYDFAIDRGIDFSGYTKDEDSPNLNFVDDWFR
jgi:hypothetical protein